MDSQQTRTCMDRSYQSLSDITNENCPKLLLHINKTNFHLCYEYMREKSNQLNNLFFSRVRKIIILGHVGGRERMLGIYP